MNKYNAVKTYSALCQRTFDSKLEAKRGEQLRLMEMAGEITDLKYQIGIILSRDPKVSIAIDFRYVNKGQTKWTYEDVKGVLTRDFRTKLAWLKEKYAIEVKLLRREDI